MASFLIAGSLQAKAKPFQPSLPHRLRGPRQHQLCANVSGTRIIQDRLEPNDGTGTVCVTETRVNVHHNSPPDDTASLNSHPGDDSSQASETSDTSEASSPGFRPVPRKRTFLCRHPLNSDSGSDAPASPASVVPAPRQSRQVAQEDAVSAADENPQQGLKDEDQPVFSESKHGGTLSLKGDRSGKVFNASAKALTTVKLKDGEVSGPTQGPGAALT